MYPKRDIPVVQLSVDADASPEEKLDIGRSLQGLRNAGIFIIGSGNIVHNLRMVSFKERGGYDWARDFDASIKEAVLNRDEHALINYHELGDAVNLAVPTTDHFDPLLYVFGATDAADSVTVFNDERIYGSLSMTSYLFE
jgi:4,5-DOPA dioxygenase extradiol